MSTYARTMAKIINGAEITAVSSIVSLVMRIPVSCRGESLARKVPCRLDRNQIARSADGETAFDFFDTSGCGDTRIGCGFAAAEQHTDGKTISDESFCNRRAAVAFDCNRVVTHLFLPLEFLRAERDAGTQDFKKRKAGPIDRALDQFRQPVRIAGKAACN